MSKISYEQKISAVELVASGVNIQEASRRSGISKTYLRQLWLRYRNGDNLRSREKTQQTYNDEFKLMVLETMRRDRLSYQETAVRFHIVNISIIHAWRVKFASEGPDRRQPQKKGRRLPMSCYQTPFCELPTPQEDKTSNGNTSTPNVPRGHSDRKQNEATLPLQKIRASCGQLLGKKRINPATIRRQNKIFHVEHHHRSCPQTNKAGSDSWKKRTPSFAWRTTT